MWRLAGGVWVVRETTGALRNGFDGRRLERIEDVWSLPAPPRELDEVSVNYLRPLPDQTFQLSVMMTLRHPARESTALGRGVGAVLTRAVRRGARRRTERAGPGNRSALGDSAQLVWGLHEPASARWNPACPDRP